MASIARGEGNRARCRQRRRKRRVAGRIPDGRRARLVHSPRVGGAHHRAAVGREVPRDADAWLDVRVVLLINLVEIHADPQQRLTARVEHDESVVPLRGRHVPLVSQPQLETESVRDGDVVLEEQRHGPLVDETPPLAERDIERVCCSGQERLDAREVEQARPFGEILVDEVPVLAAELHRVPAPAVAQRVGEDVERVVPALRKNRRTTEVEVARDNDLRQPNRTGHAVRDAIVHRIQRRSRIRAPVQTVPAEPRFVQETWLRRCALR